MTHGKDTDTAVRVIDAGSRGFLEGLFGQDRGACAKVIDFVSHDVSFSEVVPSFCVAKSRKMALHDYSSFVQLFRFGLTDIPKNRR